MLRSSLSLFLGLLLCTIGQDVVSGFPRLTFGSMELLDGVNFLPAVVGLFGLAEVVHGVVHPSEFAIDRSLRLPLRSIFPRWSEFCQTLNSMLRGCVVGFVSGVLPGIGASVCTLVSYGVEKRLSKTPELFGKGALEGVAGPESANNASNSGAFVPLLTLGIPGSSTGAVLIGAFILLGIQPGPGLFSDHPEIAWGLIASLYIGNVLLFVQNTAMIPLFIWLLRVSMSVLPVIVASLYVVGVYSINNSMTDVWIMLIFGVLGYVFKLTGIPAASLIIALVLAPMTENSFRQSLVISMGSLDIFFIRPITTSLIVLAALVALLPVAQQLFRRRTLPR